MNECKSLDRGRYYFACTFSSLTPPGGDQIACRYCWARACNACKTSLQRGEVRATRANGNSLAELRAACTVLSIGCLLLWRPRRWRMFRTARPTPSCRAVGRQHSAISGRMHPTAVADPSSGGRATRTRVSCTTSGVHATTCPYVCACATDVQRVSSMIVASVRTSVLYCVPQAREIFW